MLNLIHAAVRVFLDVLAVAFVLEHTRELHEKHREINDAPKQVAGVAVSYTHLTLPTTPYV